MSNTDARGNVRVVVRVRPRANAGVHSELVSFPKLREVQIHHDSVSAQEYEQQYALTSSSELVPQPRSGVKRFTYNDVFDEKSTQNDIFQSIGIPMLNKALEGYNGTIFAYGQTASGKTHTMFGPRGGGADVLADPAAASELGIVPQFFSMLFEMLEKKRVENNGEITPETPSSSGEGNAFSFTVTLGVIELYNEVLRDLVCGADSHNGFSDRVRETRCSTSNGEGLRIREDISPGGRGIYVEGLSEHIVSNTDQAMTIIRTAAARKVIAQTAMNNTSSRSHTILVLRIEQVDHVQHDTKTDSQIFFVDLAGSERVDKTGAMGDRLKEAQNINLSLSLLGNVISKLTDEKAIHIPYRDAKLTRLLQQSLGGNSLTTLICTVSPDHEHMSETTSSLLFAERANKIKNFPVQNIVRGLEEVTKELAIAQETIRILRERLEVLERIGVGPKQNCGSCIASSQDVSTEEAVSTINSLLIEIQQLKEELTLRNKEVLTLRDSVRFHTAKEQEMQKKAAQALEQSLKSRSTAEAALKQLSQYIRSDKSLKKRQSTPCSRNGSGQSGVSPTGAAVQLHSSLQKPPLGRTRRSANDEGAGRKVGTLLSSVSIARKLAEISSPDLSSSLDSVTEKAREEGYAEVREHVLTARVSSLEDELTRASKYQVLAERQEKEAVEQRRLSDAQATEIKALMGELEFLREQKQELETSLSEYKIKELDRQIEENMKKKEVEKAKTEKLTAGEIRDERVRNWVIRLEAENLMLHEENQNNGSRLVEMTKKIDSLSESLRELREDRDEMKRDIEMHSMEDGILRSKLVAALNRHSNVVQMNHDLRQRVLDCFAIVEREVKKKKK